MNADLAARLAAFETPELKEFIDYARYRASAKREYAASVAKDGYENYAEEINEDATLIELAADLLAEAPRHGQANGD